MGLTIIAKMVCDDCKTEVEILNEEFGEFWHDYLFSPEKVPGWVEVYPAWNESKLLCPECAKKEENRDYPRQ